MTPLIEKLEQLLTTATQTEIKSFLIDFINQEDELNISATQGLDTTAYLHYLNSLKPVQQCSCFELAQRFQEQNYLGNYSIPNRAIFYDRVFLRCSTLMVGNNLDEPAFRPDEIT